MFRAYHGLPGKVASSTMNLASWPLEEPPSYVLCAPASAGWEPPSPCSLHVRRQGLQMAQEGNDLPDVAVRRQVLPSAHAAVAHAVLNDPKHLPVRLERWLRIKLRDARIEPGCAPLAGLACVAVATRAPVAVELQASHQIYAGRRSRILEFGGLPIDRGGERFPSDKGSQRGGLEVAETETQPSKETIIAARGINKIPTTRP